MARTAKTVDQSKITDALSREISGEIKTAVDSILAKHGLVRGKISTGYGDRFEFKVTAYANETGRNGINLASREAILFPLIGAAHGLTADDLGCEFTYMGQRWILVGAKNSAKTPIIAQRVTDGKRYMLPEADLVISAIKAAR
jgi:hypothetical protein